MYCCVIQTYLHVLSQILPVESLVEKIIYKKKAQFALKKIEKKNCKKIAKKLKKSCKKVAKNLQNVKKKFFSSV